METKTNYTIVGLSVLILTAALIATALWLSVGFDQKKYSTYAVYIHEAVSGLNEESAVKFNGVQVGTVSKIRLNPNDPQQVKILLNIDSGIPVTTSTTATLISQGITGNTYVGLSASSSDLTLLQKIPNEPYPIIPTRPSLFTQLDSVLKEVSDNVNNVSIRLNRVLDEENAQAIKKTLANLQNFSSVIATNDKNISRTLKSTSKLAKNLAEASEDLPSIIKGLQQAIVSLNSMTKSVKDAGQKVGDAMNSGKTAMNKISQQTLPPAITLLRRLDTIAANLEQVSAQIRQNPAVVIRGASAPKLGPGE